MPVVPSNFRNTSDQTDSSFNVSHCWLRCFCTIELLPVLSCHVQLLCRFVGERQEDFFHNSRYSFVCLLHENATVLKSLHRWMCLFGSWVSLPKSGERKNLVVWLLESNNQSKYELEAPNQSPGSLLQPRQYFLPNRTLKRTGPWSFVCLFFDENYLQCSPHATLSVHLSRVPCK